MWTTVEQWVYPSIISCPRPLLHCGKWRLSSNCISFNNDEDAVEKILIFLPLPLPQKADNMFLREKTIILFISRLSVCQGAISRPKYPS